MMSNIVSSQFVTKRGKEVNFENVGDFNRMFFYNLQRAIDTVIINYDISQRK